MRSGERVSALRSPARPDSICSHPSHSHAASVGRGAPLSHVVYLSALSSTSHPERSGKKRRVRLPVRVENPGNSVDSGKEGLVPVRCSEGQLLGCAFGTTAERGTLGGTSSKARRFQSLRELGKQGKKGCSFTPSLPSWRQKAGQNDLVKRAWLSPSTSLLPAASVEGTVWDGE